MKIIGTKDCHEFLSEMGKNYSKANSISKFTFKGNEYIIKFDSQNEKYNLRFVPKFDGDILMIITKPRIRKSVRTNEILTGVNKKKVNVFVLELITIEPIKRLFGHSLTGYRNINLYCPFSTQYSEEILCITNEELDDEDIKKIKSNLKEEL